MKIPSELEDNIEKQLKNVKLIELKEISKNLSNRYMNEKRMGQSLLNKELEALAYSVIRMPATFCAINKVLEETIKRYNINIDTALDVGSGTGAGEWAIYNNRSNIKEILCIEREKNMMNLAKKLLEDYKNITWKSQDIVKNKVNDKADLVIVSYIINELLEDVKEKVINDMFNAFNKVLIFVEPGTPEGFNNIRKIQHLALKNNLYVIAPCTGQAECKLPKDDWCHSVIRVERNKIHKFLKSAEVPYEDEKFSYIAISKQKLEVEGSRILRHPNISSGFIKAKLCTNGIIEEKTFTKKEKETFKKVKKSKCGDLI